MILEAASIRDARLAWAGAQYARFAFHQPNEMPPEPTLDGAKRNRIDPDVAREMEKIRLRVKMEFDRRHHGR